MGGSLLGKNMRLSPPESAPIWSCRIEQLSQNVTTAARQALADSISADRGFPIAGADSDSRGESLKRRLLTRAQRQ